MKKVLRLLVLLTLCVSFAGCEAGKGSAERSADPTAAAAESASPAPETEATIDRFSYEPVREAVCGMLGENKLYAYYLACSYRSVAEAFVKRKHDYDPNWTVAENLDFTKRMLQEKDPASGKTNREILQAEALQRCLRMLVMNREAQKNGAILPEKTLSGIEVHWKTYGVQYYSRLKELFPYVDSPDRAMELMAGCNVEEAIAYTKTRDLASQYAIAWFYENHTDNEEFAAYYRAHVNDFRRVTVRAVFVREKEQAESVRRQMNDRPEFIPNLAKAYNEDSKLAETQGLTEVTSASGMVPEAVKQWAYAQTEDTLFAKHGEIAVVETEQGTYLLMCESIKEFGDEEGNEVYASVGEACKEEQLNRYLDGLLAGEPYLLTDYDAAKAAAAMDAGLPV